MIFFSRVMPKTIAAQIACLVVVAVLLGVGLASAAMMHFFYSSQAGVNADIVPAVRAARIATIVRRAREARSQHELAAMLATARSTVVTVSQVSLPQVLPPRPGAQPAFVRAVEDILTRTWGLLPLPDEDEGAIVIEVNDNAALKFEAAPDIFPLNNLLPIQTTFALAIIVVMVLLLSLYALRRITAPLSAVAAAARSLRQRRRPDPRNRAARNRAGGGGAA